MDATLQTFRELRDVFMLDGEIKSFDVISNLVMYGGLDEAVVADTYKAIYDKQAEVNSAFAALDADGITAEAATTFSKETAEDVYAFAVSLANELSGK